MKVREEHALAVKALSILGKNELISELIAIGKEEFKAKYPKYSYLFSEEATSQSPCEMQDAE